MQIFYRHHRHYILSLFKATVSFSTYFNVKSLIRYGKLKVYLSASCLTFVDQEDVRAVWGKSRHRLAAFVREAIAKR